MEVVSFSESVSPTTRKRSISFSFTPDNNNNTTTNHAAAAKLDAVAKAKCAELNKDSPLKRRRRQRLLNVASCSSDSVAQQHFVLLAQLSHTPRHQFATANSNVLKNRYPNILANESTRVRLARSNAASLSLSLLQTDYINANHIQLDNSPSKFILTQAPLPHTIEDFWTMCFENKTNVIVCLTNFDYGRANVYFPLENCSSTFGAFNVETVNKIEFGEIVLRHLNITRNNESRRILHLHYTAWPDFGVPKSCDSILRLWGLMRTANLNSDDCDSAAVVHCSAGVGRAGTFVAAASIIERELHLNNQQQHTPVNNAKQVDDDDNTNAMFVNDAHRHRSLSEPLDSSAREAVLARSDALFDNNNNNNNHDNSSTCTHVDDNNDNDNHQPHLVQQRVETVLSRGAGVDFDVIEQLLSSVKDNNINDNNNNNNNNNNDDANDKTDIVNAVLRNKLRALAQTDLLRASSDLSCEDEEDAESPLPLSLSALSASNSCGELDSTASLASSLASTMSASSAGTVRSGASSSMDDDSAEQQHAINNNTATTIDTSIETDCAPYDNAQFTTVFQDVIALRQQRAGCVQTACQFVLLHRLVRLVKLCIASSDTNTPQPPQSQ